MTPKNVVLAAASACGSSWTFLVTFMRQIGIELEFSNACVLFGDKIYL